MWIAAALTISAQAGKGCPVDIGDKPKFAPPPPAETPKTGKSPLERIENKG